MGEYLLEKMASAAKYQDGAEHHNSADKCNNLILPLPVVHYDSQGGTILKKELSVQKNIDPSKSFSAQSPIQVYGGAASIVPVLSEALTCTSSVTQQQQVIHFLQK